MNIYCIIFMCTFGANNTDTEMPLNNTLINGPNISSGMENGTATAPVDVAAMILPERGEPVPQMGDIVMDLPNIHDTPIKSAASSYSDSVDDSSAASNPPRISPTLSDILLPPSAQLRNQNSSSKSYSPKATYFQ